MRKKRELYRVASEAPSTSLPHFLANKSKLFRLPCCTSVGHQEVDRTSNVHLIKTGDRSWTVLLKQVHAPY